MLICRVQQTSLLAKQPIACFYVASELRKNFYKWTFSVIWYFRNTKLWAPVKQMLPTERELRGFFIRRLVLQKLYSTVIFELVRYLWKFVFSHCYISIQYPWFYLVTNKAWNIYCVALQKKFMWSVYINHSNTAVLKNCLKKASNERVCTIFYYTYSCSRQYCLKVRSEALRWSFKVQNPAILLTVCCLQERYLASWSLFWLHL